MRVQSINNSNCKAKDKSFHGSAILTKDFDIDVFRQQCSSLVENCRKECGLITLLPPEKTNYNNGKAFMIILFQKGFENLFKPIIERFAKKHNFKAIINIEDQEIKALEDEGKKLIS